LSNDLVISDTMMPFRRQVSDALTASGSKGTFFISAYVLFLVSDTTLMAVLLKTDETVSLLHHSQRSILIEPRPRRLHLRRRPCIQCQIRPSMWTSNRIPHLEPPKSHFAKPRPKYFCLFVAATRANTFRHCSRARVLQGRW